VLKVFFTYTVIACLEQIGICSMNYGLIDILTLLGSLGLFLFGMKLMSDSLMLLAGKSMRNILASATSNRLFAVMTGFFITAAVQSSSATTLMVVSFVNANLLTLTEAVGVIMGANIGTTVTAWLITILGFKVTMSAVSLPLVSVGFLLSLSKKQSSKHWGHFIIGFAILFIGLQFLKDTVPDISAHPEALAFLAEYTSKGYLSILLFLAIGTLLTLVVQSSSATMAITLLMTYEGWIPFEMGAAMVLGENVGTTITANIAAFVANYNAKRAARAHLIFNLIGVLWILVLFYPFINLVAELVDSIEGTSPFVSALSVPIALSVFHTSFNILNVVFLIGFVPFIVKLVERMVSEVEEESLAIDEPRFLDESSMKYSQTGIKALTDESVRLLENAAYVVLAHGLSVHREELENKEDIADILSSSEVIPVDIDKIYETKIKSIYSCILQYATQLQDKRNLSEKEIEVVRNILLADRLLVQVVKRMKPLQVNIARYLASDVEAIRKEYNVLRRRILKVVRDIKRIGPSENLEEQIKKIKRHRSKAEKLDVLMSGRINELLLQGDITNEMASSLLNDSSNAERITKILVDIATILYTPRDVLIEAIDEQNEQGTMADEKISDVLEPVE